MFYPPVLHYVDEDGLFYYRAFPKLLMIEFVLNQVQDRHNRKNVNTVNNYQRSPLHKYITNIISRF